MTMQSKIRKIGNSYGIVLPREALDSMMVKEGDTVYMTRSPENGLKLTARDQEFARTMEIAEDLMSRYRNALAELAK